MPKPHRCGFSVCGQVDDGAGGGGSHERPQRDAGAAPLLADSEGAGEGEVMIVDTPPFYPSFLLPPASMG